MSKAVELPINVMVIVVIAVIILLALVAMYFTGFSPFSTAVGLEGVRGDACRRLVQENGCRVTTNAIEITSFDANKDNLMGTAETGSGWTFGSSVCGDASNGDNLASLCACYYSLSSENACKSLCGCAGGGFSAGGGGTPPSTCNCSDGITYCNECAQSDPYKPSYCDSTGNWIPVQCVVHGCSCPPSTTCQADGSCILSGPIACSWIRSYCGSDSNSALHCHDSGVPAYEYICGPSGCTGTCPISVPPWSVPAGTPTCHNSEHC